MTIQEPSTEPEISDATERPFTRRKLYAYLGMGFAYLCWIIPLNWDPPGFYIDEAVISLNAFFVASTGHGEFGQFLPLYFPVFKVPPPFDYLGYTDPVQVYLLSGLFLIFGPSSILVRLLSAICVFAAGVLLGVLGYRLTDRVGVGIVTTLLTLATPWFFEVSRLGFAAGIYAFAVVLLLVSLKSANQKTTWSSLTCLGIACALALATYSYAIGRLLGPLLALGLVIFVTRTRVVSVLKAWAFYACTLIPMGIFHFQKPGALTGRFSGTVGILRPHKDWSQVLLEFAGNYFNNLDPKLLLATGDANLRHHMAGMGPILVGEFLLAIVGVYLVFTRYSRDRWWEYVIYGLVISIIPASLTNEGFHMLRLIALPVFLIVICIPAIALVSDRLTSFRGTSVGPETPAPKRFKQLTATQILALVLLTGSFVQAVFFQLEYWQHTGGRAAWFDSSYDEMFELAIVQPSRPIYLVDGSLNRQAYVHGYWNAIIRGIDLGEFVHLESGMRAPVSSVVLSSEESCVDCQVLDRDKFFMLYVQYETAP